MAVDVNRLAKRYAELRTERSGWEDAWRDLAELFLPGRYRSDTETNAHLTPKISSRLLNSAGVLAMRTLAAGMQGGMTSPVRPWFRLTLRDPGMGRGTDGLNAWIDDVTERMRFLLHQSNFYNAVHALYADMGTFGTGLMVETADAEGLHFHVCRAGEYVLDVDGNNNVDTFYRRLHMTARQIIDKWGDGGNVPPMIMRRAEERNAGNLTERFDVIHAVFPRTDVKTSILSFESKPWASVYFLPGMSGSTAESGLGQKATVLDEGGYDSFPAFAPRWDVSGSDVYGRSPAMDVAPDCRMLQAMTATLREMQHKIADPPLVADSALKAHGVKLMPGGVTYFSSSMGNVNPVTPISQPEPQALQFSMQAVHEVQQIVTDGLYVDLFRMLLDDDRRQITATEIQARQQEKMILIGPVVERLHKELLEPLIMRTYGLMEENGALPPLPEGAELAALDVTFESVLAQAQKLSATSSIEQGFSFLANAAQADPSILDIIDPTEMGKAYLERVGMPEGCIRDDDAIEDVRQQRAEQQQQMAQQQQAQQALDQAGQMADVARNLGQTPTGANGETLLGTLLGGLGGQ